MNRPSGLKCASRVKKRIFHLREPLNILRAASDEKIFRQSKQKSACRVYPLRRIFVTNDGKDSIDSSCEEFLEVPYIDTIEVEMI